MENSEVLNKKLIRIAVVGPESTGKSTISRQLALHYNTVWVPEYARGYCEKLVAECTWEDEINMFKGQLELEEQMSPLANRLLICDTTFITVKIWSDHMFGRAPQEVIEKLPVHNYDLYLLMNIDLPWEEDPLRNFPHMREHFMQVWHNELKALGATYSLISGNEVLRFKNAIQTIDSYLSMS